MERLVGEWHTWLCCTLSRCCRYVCRHCRIFSNTLQTWQCDRVGQAEKTKRGNCLPSIGFFKKIPPCAEPRSKFSICPCSPCLESMCQGKVFACAKGLWDMYSTTAQRRMLELLQTACWGSRLLLVYLFRETLSYIQVNKVNSFSFRSRANQISWQHVQMNSLRYKLLTCSGRSACMPHFSIHAVLTRTLTEE